MSGYMLLSGNNSVAISIQDVEVCIVPRLQFQLIILQQGLKILTLRCELLYRQAAIDSYLW